MTRVAVLGAWHLGSVTAACLAEAGHDVTVWDADPVRIDALANDRAPVAEPGLDDLLQAGRAAGRLHVEAELGTAVRDAELVWITQDTHVNDDDSVDLSDLETLVSGLGGMLANGTTVAVSSQVPVRTCDRWCQVIRDGAELSSSQLTGLAYVPENLRLGAALGRFRRPDMVVIGSTHDAAGDAIEQLLAFTGAPVVRTDVRTAELVKHGINSFLATSIAFANELAAIADAVDADAITVAKAMRLDERIGAKARIGPGLGFAGGTLARDVTTLAGIGRETGRPALLADAVLASNHRHMSWPVDRLADFVSPAGARICILGLTYTVGTSTLRRSQSVPLITELVRAGATVAAHDPEADLSGLQEPLEIDRADDPYQAAEGCDAVIVLTPWPEYLALDWGRMAKAMKGNLVLDGPNALASNSVVQHGLVLVGPGRSGSRGDG
ncbi:MAG TPA: nucleotide sugar dehydrogenase [Jatrophihabitans sp.]